MQNYSKLDRCSRRKGFVVRYEDLKDVSCLPMKNCFVGSETMTTRRFRHI